MDTANLYAEFSKEFEAGRVHASEYKLGGEVFSQSEVTCKEFFVGREEEVKSLGRGLHYCVDGAKNKIILHGLPGVGKSSLLVFLEEREENEGDIALIRLPSLGFPEDQQNICNMILNRTIIKFYKCLSKERTAERDKLLIELDKLNKLVISEKEVGEKIKKIAELGFCSSSPNSELGPGIVVEVLQHLFEKYKGKKDRAFFLIVDEYHKLGAFGIQEVLREISQNTKLYPIVLMHTTEFEQLDPQFLKNAHIINIPPMKNPNLIEILRLRIVAYHNSKNIEKLSAPSKDLVGEIKPFEINVLEYLADVSKGIPLTFIIRSEETYNAMCRYNSTHDKPITSISIIFAKNMEQVAPNPLVTANRVVLTDAERMVYACLSNSTEGITTDAILKSASVSAHNISGKSYKKPYMTMLLTRLLNKKVVTKQRHGKIVLYSPVRGIEVV